MSRNQGWFHSYVEAARRRKQLIVQPRMGFSEPPKMRLGLESVSALPGARIGTITLDSMTRQRMWTEAESAVKRGIPLNGFPMVTFGAKATHGMLDGLQGSGFPVQVRHGSPLPNRVFEVAHEAGIDAIEGGPISYCLPYGRVPLKDCVKAWGEASRYWALAGRSHDAINHLESFAGCMMGQLAPPDLLAALSVLEGMFFVERGIVSLSLSYSQGTNFSQDVGAVLALRRLAQEYLPASVSWHIVLYTWMGVFPQSESGAKRLIQNSGALAAIGSVERVIVKTAVEALQIPTINDNIDALKWVAASAEEAKGLLPNSLALDHADAIYRQSMRIINAVLNMATNLDEAILRAFARGILDVPFCFHPDNRNQARAAIDPHTGVVRWDRTGAIPVDVKWSRVARRSTPITADQLLTSLTFNQRKYDEVKP